MLEAQREADEAWTTWRLHYGMPPNDPRALEVDEETVLHDLLVLKIHQDATIRAANPDKAAVDALKKSKRQAADMVRRTLRWFNSEDTQRRIAAMRGVRYPGDGPEEPAPRPTGIRVRRS